MPVFFYSELDFIFFFYGLAFVLLGTVCFAIARTQGRGLPWAALGLFAYLHGATDWLDLAALIIGNAPWFAAARLAILTGAFIFLMEFAQFEALRLGLKAPGRWIYAPLVALVAAGGLIGGLSLANVLARYTIGFSSAMATSLVFFFEKPHPHARHKYWWAISAALAFALYGIAAGAIVPAAPFWPADVLNYDNFVRVTGMPIQFVRGLLACWMTLSIWGYWRQNLILDVASPRYTRYLQKQFIWTLAAMATVLVLGWTLTEYLGRIYKHNVQEEALGDLDLIAGHLAGETAITEGMVKSLAGSPSIITFLADKQDEERAKRVLELDIEASGAKLGYLLDRTGAVVAAFGPGKPNVATAISADAGYKFEFNAASGEGEYTASYPVRDEAGKLVGTAVLKKSLSGFEADLKRFDHPFFLIDPHGVVVLTNRPKSFLQTLWPLPSETQVALSLQFGRLNGTPMLADEIAEAKWISIEGQRGYLRRRYTDHGDWSLVTVTLPQKLFANRVLGIFITLTMTIVTLVFLSGGERGVRDNVQLDKRLELEELARKLDFRATTDPLTGLFNRRKLNHELSLEIARSERYGASLSVVIFDVDHFKAINDTHGHQFGDKVLIELSKFVAGLIRKTDVLARWGGEEFMILVPGSNGHRGRQFAESLRESLRRFATGEARIVTCSFGVAEFVAGDTAETLIARADEALYRAKVNGRDRVELASAVSVPDEDIRSAINQ
jgi:diguanylate cyclase (GGDEF)-like protein